MTGRHPMLSGDPGCFVDLSRLRVLASVIVDRSPSVRTSAGTAGRPMRRRLFHLQNSNALDEG
jgi:hypothetical protein